MSSKLKLVEFQAQDGVVLPGLLYEPASTTNRVLLYLHGNGSSSVFYKAQLMNTFAKQLNKLGISFFPFNNRGAHYIKKLKKVVGTETVEFMQGMVYEKIKDCIFDIEGAISFLENLGYRQFYLAGSSTGANKICVYNFYKPKNRVYGYILLGGGDDSGIYYQQMGREKFLFALKKCQEEINNGHATKLVPKYLTANLISYQSLYDIINPDGDYNIFPFYEYFHGLKLATKKLFQEYAAIKKPTLVVYGEKDEYCYNKVPEILALLKKKTSVPEKFEFALIPHADHTFTDKQLELNHIICKWLAKHK